MTVFLLEFQSWYWSGHFDDPELRGAYEAMNEPTTTEEFGRGFLTLLRSDDTAATGIALDFYDRAEMTERFVGGNPFEDYDEEVFQVARELLQQPPRPRDEQAKIEGANHASALAALSRHGLTEEDTDVIIQVLERMPAVSLRERALDAARVLLEDSKVPDPRLSALVARVEACFERVEAVRALRDSQDAEATERLVLAIEDDEWRVRQEAAAALSLARRFYAHRPLLEGLVETWPDGERSDAADEVREALAEGPHSLHWEEAELDGELLESHRQLRTPTSEDAHRNAFCTMLRSGRTAAVGIALDHYYLADGLTRFGIDDGEYAAEVLTIARGILSRPSASAGADHASALGILEVLGEPEDAETIVAALRARETPAVVRERAVDVAWECLERWETPGEKIVAALEDLIFDGSLDMELRTRAVNALFGLGPVPRVTRRPGARGPLRRAAHPGGGCHRSHIPRSDRRASVPATGTDRVVARGCGGTGRDRPERAGRQLKDQIPRPSRQAHSRRATPNADLRELSAGPLWTAQLDDPAARVTRPGPGPAPEATGPASGPRLRSSGLRACPPPLPVCEGGPPGAAWRLLTRWPGTAGCCL